MLENIFPDSDEKIVEVICCFIRKWADPVRKVIKCSDMSSFMNQLLESHLWLE